MPQGSSCPMPSPCSSFCVFDSAGYCVPCRFKLWQLDQKWSYAGGMNPVKKAERQRSTAIWCRQATCRFATHRVFTHRQQGCWLSNLSIQVAPMLTLPAFLQGTVAAARAHIHQGQLGVDPTLAGYTLAARPTRLEPGNTAVPPVSIPCLLCADSGNTAVLHRSSLAAGWAALLQQVRPLPSSFHRGAVKAARPRAGIQPQESHRNCGGRVWGARVAAVQEF